MMLAMLGTPDPRTATAGAAQSALGIHSQWMGAEVHPAPAGQARVEDLRRLLETFEPITLAQMAGATLLDRSEIKYVLPQVLLAPVLAELRGAYRALVVAGQPLSRYRTLYFDTGDLALYRRHHAGAPDRYKVRAREYLDSQAAFLEVKHRMGARHTIKSRIPTETPVTALPAQAAGFLARACPYAADELAATLWNHYTRITLVSKTRVERVTLDVDLAFLRDDVCVGLPGIVVAEVKYRGLRHASEFARLMRTYRLHGTGFSKYCMGISLLYPEVKHNKLKAKQRLVARLAQAG